MRMQLQLASLCNCLIIPFSCEAQLIYDLVDVDVGSWRMLKKSVNNNFVKSGVLLMGTSHMFYKTRRTILVCTT